MSQPESDFSSPHESLEHGEPVSRTTNAHPMQTRSKSGIHTPRIHHSLFLAHSEPKGVKQDLAYPNWLSAMQLEYVALLKNHT